jgi:uncharacterized protein YjbK
MLNITPHDTSRGVYMTQSLPQPTPYQECEFKIMLTDAADYHRLLAHTSKSTQVPIKQTNHFFDTSEMQLDHLMSVLRLRQEQQHFSLTLKAKGETSHNPLLSQKIEIERPIQAKKAQELLQGQGCPLATLLQCVALETEESFYLQALQGRLSHPLVHIGHFANLRVRVPFAVPSATGSVLLQLEIDATSFPEGRTDHEVELEVPDPQLFESAQSALLDLLSQLNIEAKPSSSKAGRFFAVLKNNSAPTSI